MSSYRPIAAPETIPPGTSDHIAAAIRRNKLEEQQARILQQIAAELGITPRLERRHNQRNATKYRAKVQRRMRIADAPEPFTRDEIIARDHSTCHLCGHHVDRADIHIDHDIPLSRGGTHTRTNVHVACSTCNTRKGTMTTSEYRASLRSHSSMATRTNE